MKILTAADFLTPLVKLKRESVSIPEMGGEVIVQELTGALRDEFDAAVMNRIEHVGGKIIRQNPRGLRAKLLILSLVDEAGHPLFTDKDSDRLNQLSGSILDRLGEVARRISNISEEPERAAQTTVKS